MKHGDGYKEGKEGEILPPPTMQCPECWGGHIIVIFYHKPRDSYRERGRGGGGGGGESPFKRISGI